MPAPFRDTLPKIEWDEVTTSVTDIVSVDDDEISGAGGMSSRGWEYWNHDYGGPYIPFWGAPAVHPETITGPSAVPIGAFANDTGFTNWAVLGGWVDGGGIYTSLMTSWAEKTFTGLTPGDTVGIQFTFGYVLDLNGGNVFGEVEGVTVNRWSAMSSGIYYWDFDGNPIVEGDFISAVVPPSGDFIVRLGWENMGPTGSNGQGGFGNFRLAVTSCADTVTTHRLDFRYPLEEVRCWTDPRAGSEWLRLPSGVEDAWTLGEDGYLEAEVRWIPRGSSVSPLNDGWDPEGAVPGWQRFLAWARRPGNTFRFFPDADDDDLSYECQLIEPRGDPAIEDDLPKGFAIKLRVVDGGPLIEGY